MFVQFVTRNPCDLKQNMGQFDDGDNQCIYWVVSDDCSHKVLAKLQGYVKKWDSWQLAWDR